MIKTCKLLWNVWTMFRRNVRLEAEMLKLSLTTIDANVLKPCADTYIGIPGDRHVDSRHFSK